MGARGPAALLPSARSFFSSLGLPLRWSGLGRPPVSLIRAWALPGSGVARTGDRHWGARCRPVERMPFYSTSQCVSPGPPSCLSWTVGGPGVPGPGSHRVTHWSWWQPVGGGGLDKPEPATSGAPSTPASIRSCPVCGRHDVVRTVLKDSGRSAHCVGALGLIFDPCGTRSVPLSPQKRKPRHREVEGLAQGHSTRWQTWDLSSGQSPCTFRWSHTSNLSPRSDGLPGAERAAPISGSRGSP